MASFDLSVFVLSPSYELLDRCRKVDLLSIADFFDVVIPRSATKRDIRKLLESSLVERGVLPVAEEVPGIALGLAQSTDPAGAESEAVVSPRMGPRSSPMFDPRMEIKLKELELEIKIQEREAESLRLRALQIDAEKEVTLKRLSMGLERPLPQPRKAASPTPTSPAPLATPVPKPRSIHLSGNPTVPVSVAERFDISRQISMVPTFRENEVDAYFAIFERIATTLSWPRAVWPLLLQCKLVGKAQDVCSSLSLEQSVDYDTVKAAVLRAYELVPEAYRQNFRQLKKKPTQTHVEFAREKTVLFDKWCSASDVTSLQQLKELVLIEEFKNCLPDSVVMYLNEHKVSTLSNAAICADEFVLTHRTVFTTPVLRSESTSHSLRSRTSVSPVATEAPAPPDSRECFYCHVQGHIIANCPALKKKNARSAKKVHCTNIKVPSSSADSVFEPFLFDGTVSLCESDPARKTITGLRDTGAAVSLLLDTVLPLSEDTYTGQDVLVQGIELGVRRLPLHNIYLHMEGIAGMIRVAVSPALPVSGVSFILGNDIAGSSIFPLPIVVDRPSESISSSMASDSPAVYPACVLTRAQARKAGSTVSLVDTFMCDPPVSQPVDSDTLVLSPPSPITDVNRDALVAAQKLDKTLLQYFNLAEKKSGTPKQQQRYSIRDGVLIRTWSPSNATDGWDAIHQIVVPTSFRSHVLQLAHEHPLSGHLGIRKTVKRILSHFFWPSLSSDVARFCHSCHTCQLVGKPNQVIPPAPLCPIPVVGEPFERLLVDCVGPLPKTRSGNSYLLTLMCATTRFPEAIPLRSLKSKVIVKALIKFCTTFGIPKCIQSDQGSNFMSKLFEQVVKELDIEHKVSSAYHPESQGALERFHQTFKTMLRTFCHDCDKDWDEGVPLLLFAIRDTVQDSTGYSPNTLLFGRTVRGPLRLLYERWLGAPQSTSTQPVCDFVETLRKRLSTVREIASRNLKSVQADMKIRYDQKAVDRSFKVGDRVLVLLPIPGSPLCTRFSGPYMVKAKTSPTNYILATPDRRRKSRLCHINLLKPYIDRHQPDSLTQSEASVISTVPVAVTAKVPPSEYVPEQDDLRIGRNCVPCARLPNSLALQTLPQKVAHLPTEAQTDVISLIHTYPSLFSDVPTRTSVLQHDILIDSPAPIRQHPYRVNPHKRSLLRKETDYLLEHGLAVPSISPWCSPCLLVPKPDGTFRLCTDYRKVNAVTVPDSYPMPRMEDCIDRIGSARFVSKLDLLKGYWQVPLTTRASDISAFATPDQFLQYTVMPFGLRNAPSTFQRLMNMVLGDVQNCEVYLDDVVIYTSSWAHHIQVLDNVFRKLQDASLVLNMEKCDFGKGEIIYLGKVVGNGTVRPLNAKVDAICAFPAPETRRHLRRFLGMAGYYRCFCPNFSDVVAPMSNLLCKNVPFVWSPACQRSFEAVKSLLISAPVLAAPDYDRPFKLEVDASGTGIGAVLVQEDMFGVDHPTCYFSRKFNKHQLAYSTIEKEALALLLALQHFEVYLGGSAHPITVFTDHNPLVFLQRMANANQRLMRWSLIVQGFNIHIVHKRGLDNVVADALSRCC
ncbi:uncharacterized protein LOC143512733 [Brachyhypopomus gauderio]|uniref:uncharacterized protein LOC143512733 n=1 Tax=Brachyhypopomus gauderio TaxID=698409 RepID=UPI0040432DA4